MKLFIKVLILRLSKEIENEVFIIFQDLSKKVLADSTYLKQNDKWVALLRFMRHALTEFEQLSIE
jgi:hypothetical protein